MGGIRLTLASFYLDAIDETSSEFEKQHAAMTRGLSGNVDKLEKEFPGVTAAELRVLKETQ